ncbi:hypothetical protein [Paraburkholderia sacchari]|uniref:Uncharacterized protein n=1 Tax=Paraburkholderia sacchari TaxID=159450 RepID=A0A8T6ZHC2_9BURK|nr:hypothetical protein [Paraburkholderia sacchari]NLP63903.1 hypothetical protein [Paraburkholderia sacchari]
MIAMLAARSTSCAARRRPRVWACLAANPGHRARTVLGARWYLAGFLLSLRGEGDWTHRVAGAWGDVRLAAGKRLCEIKLGETRGAYIFADLQGAQPARDASGWQVQLRVADAGPLLWSLPMPSEREAKRWARIFTLAIAQKL